MAAELRLNVALDLQYFKRQLPKLSQAAAGFQLPIQIKFDGRQLRRELNKLTGRREFRINLNDTSIKSAIDNVKTLKRELEGLERKSRQATASSTPIGTSRLSKTEKQGGFKAAEIQALYRQAAAQGVEGFQTGIKLNRSDAVRELAKLSAEAVKGLIAGLKKGKGQVGSASEKLAVELIDTMEARLEISSPSRRLMRMGRQAAKGFEVGMSNGLKRAQSTILAQLQAMLIAMQAEVRGFGQQGGFAQIGAASRGAMGAPGRMLTSSSGRPRFRSPSVSGPLGVSSALTGPSLYGQGRLALPAAGQSTASLAQASKEAAAKVRAYGRSAERAAAVLGENDRVTGSGYRGLPSRSTGSALALSSRGAGASGGGGGGFGRSLGLLGGMPQLPGAGSVRELASEFGNATKQVLLFGTAYKGLAFLMDFPSQVGAAVGALQSFNNTLKAISPNAEAAADSNAFILDIVDRYNVPLQSARDGFTKLYASMAPAGFEGDQIEEIFLGISQAAATFGMSSDKVDRMNYAFAQMASKGQIMSEELKGQLGDVLPGAMGIFAEAAGLEGPDAIQKFSKALEDGAFQGENMVALLKNVGQVMQDEFGPGAEGAARTFQGLMNRMQNSMKLLYEAFEPVAVQFLNAVVVPMTKGIKAISDGVSAYFSQTAASTREGQAFANQLKSLEGAFKGIKANVIGVIEIFKQFSQALLPVVKLLLQIAGNPIIGYLARLYAIVLPLNIAFRVTRGALAAVNVQMLLFKARTAAGVKTITAFRAMMVTTGASAKATSASIRGLGLAIKSALGSTVIGGIIIGIGILIEKIITLRSKMDEVRVAAQQASAAIQHMTGTQAASTEQEAQADVETLRNLRKRTQGRFGKIEVSKAEQAALERSGQMPVEFATQRGAFGGVTKTAMGTSDSQVLDAIGQASERRTLASNRAALVRKEEAEREAELKAELAKIALESGGDDGDDGGGGTDQSDSAAILRIKQQIAEEERGMLLNEKGRNELNLIRLNQELKFQEIAEMNVNEATKAVLREEARIEAGKKYTKVFQELANATVKEADENRKALEQQKDSRATLAGIILEAQYASKQISEEEYKTAKFLLEQEATRRRIAGLPGLTPEERQQGVDAVDSMQPPAEQGKVSAWIEKTEKELEDFEGMATSAADSIASEFGTAFSGILQGTTSLSEGLGNAFKNIGSMFADMVMQMLAKWAMLQVMKSLFPGMAEGGVVSASGGGGMPSLVPGFANGGIVKGPTMAMVGEGRFNEAVVPLPNGKAIPVDMGGSAGNNIATNITVNVNNGQASSKTSGSQGNDLARNLEGAVKQVIMREMQPGGMISKGK